MLDNWIRSLEENYWKNFNVDEYELFDDKHLILCHSALYVAVASGHDLVVSRLLDEEDNALTCHDYTGRTPLHEAIRKNRSKIVRILLEKQPKLIHYKCKHWQQMATPTPRQDSFRFSSEGMLSAEEFREYNEDICHCGYTPLHLAARYGHEQLGILLIDKGARVDGRDCSGATPIHVAACHNLVGIISIFSHPFFGDNINGRAFNGSTPLHSAAACGAVKAIDYLLYHKANLTAVDDYGLTALHYSVLHAKSSQFGHGVFLNDS